nr:ATP-binding protein [Aromatoleum buckelii]
MQQLARVPVLIIDDFGLKPLRSPADEDLHDLIAERYEQAATVVTSNLDFAEWDQAFHGNRLLASATVDRLRHNAYYCLTLDGASYRAPRQGPNRAKTARDPEKQRILNPADVRQSPFTLAPICQSSVARMCRSVTCGEMGYRAQAS